MRIELRHLGLSCFRTYVPLVSCDTFLFRFSFPLHLPEIFWQIK